MIYFAILSLRRWLTGWIVVYRCIAGGQKNSFFVFNPNPIFFVALWLGLPWLFSPFSFAWLVMGDIYESLIDYANSETLDCPKWKVTNTTGNSQGRNFVATQPISLHNVSVRLDKAQRLDIVLIVEVHRRRRCSRSILTPFSNISKEEIVYGTTTTAFIWRSPPSSESQV